MPSQKSTSPIAQPRRSMLRAGLLGLSGAGLLAGQSNGPWSPKKQAPGATPGKSSNGALISSCLRSGHLLFVSGISGWYPERRKEPGDAAVQMRSALETMKQVLERANSSMDNVLKVQVALVDPENNFEPMNEGYKGFFKDPPPVRSYFGATGFRQKGPLMQVDCIAYVD